MLKALILVRSGSKRVVNKNLRPFAGSNLLVIKINLLKTVNGLDGIVVNSNDDDMLRLAAELGCETVKRPQEFATDNCSPNDMYRWAAENFSAEHVLSTNVTVPLLSREKYEQAIVQYRDMAACYDSLVSVTPLKEFLLKDGIPLNFDKNNKPRSQDLPENFALMNHSIHILPRAVMQKNSDIIGSSPKLFHLDPIEAWDIDTQVQFDFAEFMYRRMQDNGKIK